MKIKVTALFRDRANLQVYHQPGEVMEVDEERGENIIALGLGERLEPQPTGVEVKDEPSGEAPAAPSEPEQETADKEDTEEKTDASPGPQPPADGASEANTEAQDEKAAAEDAPVKKPRPKLKKNPKNSE